MSDSPGRSAGNGPELRLTVDVVLYHLLARTAAARAECLVLRRTVFTALPDASEVWVEELWTSETAAHVHHLLAVARGVAGSARRLVLGEPVVVPDMEPVTGPVVDELVALVDRTGTGGVDQLVGFRGTVDVDGRARTLGHGELLCPSAGVLARPLRSAFRRVITELGCSADGATGGDSGPADEPAGTADALRADLRDAQARDDQHALWRSIAGARLGPPVDPASSVAMNGHGPVFAHWPRRTADGTTLVPPDGARTDLDSAAVTVVEAADVEGRLNLHRHPLDARLDLRTVLRQERVRAAFAAYAVSGCADPALREAAVAALLSAGAPGEADGSERRIDAPAGTSTGPWPAGTVVVTDCRDVQVGNHLQQYTTVTATVAPIVGGAALLRDHPDLVESIVGHACGVDGPPRRDVQRRLQEAVFGSAGTETEIEHGERPAPTEPAATWTNYPLLAPPDPEWVDRVVEVVGRAVANGVSTEPLRAALCGAMAEPDAVDRALREIDPGAAGLRDALLAGEVVGQDRLTEVVAALEAQVEHATGRVVVEQDADTGTVRTTWLHPHAPHERLFTGPPDGVRVVLIRTATDDDTQVDVAVHELADPQVDLATFVRDPQVWTAAVVESRTVQVGDHSYQKNRIVASISPTLRAATLLTHDPDLVDSLIGVASAREHGAVTARLREAVRHARLATDGHGSVRRWPAAGRTLQVGRAAGTRVSQKNHHLRRAVPDRHVGPGTPHP